MRILITLLFIFSLLLTASSDIQFEEVSQQAGINRIGESWGNAWVDFDGDGYLDLWANNHRHKPSFYRNNGDGTFTNIIDEVWDANPTADTHGVAWADFDNDGDQDMITVSGASGGCCNVNINHHNHFYVNENGLLIERAVEFGVNYPYLRGRIPFWFDSNQDGRLDLLLLGDIGTDKTGAPVTSAMFEQTIGGFENITTAAGLILTGARIAQYTDLTADGSMKLVIGSQAYPRAIYDISEGFFINAMGTFSIPRSNFVQDIAVADFNGDLRLDFFLARTVYTSNVNQIDPWNLKMHIRNNPTEKGVSFKTEGDVHFKIYSEWGPRSPLVIIGAEGRKVTAFESGKFQGVTPNLRSATFEVTLSPDDPRVIGLKPHTTPPKYAIHVGYQPDTKRWTLSYKLPAAITEVEATQPISEIENINFSIADFRQQPASQLLLNQGDRLQNANGLRIFNTFENGRCVAAGDFDNDMDIDLYLVRSIATGNIPNHLYENRGDGAFTQHVDAGGANGSMQGQGQSVTVGDYDSDGYLDLFVTNGKGPHPLSEGPDQLYRNIGGGNNWLQIDLEGTLSNRDGIGARLFATTPDGKTQLRENSGGIHWAQQDQKRIHFGLAQNEKVSELTIHWPSGIIQKLTDVPVNQVLHVVEEGVQTLIPGDVNADGQVDIIDFLIVVVHFGEKPPTNPRADTNKDGQVNLEDLILIVKAIEENQSVAAAPMQKYQTEPMNSITSLSDAAITYLHSFYQKIEEIPGDATQKALVKRFLKQLLMPVNSPLATKLYANYPNPFNPETWIPYQLAEDAEITIRIYDTSGKIVRTLFSGHQVSGYYLNRGQAAHWDGKNEFGEQVASGVYICELTTPRFKQTKRLVVVK